VRKLKVASCIESMGRGWLPFRFAGGQGHLPDKNQISKNNAHHCMASNIKFIPPQFHPHTTTRPPHHTTPHHTRRTETVFTRKPESLYACAYAYAYACIKSSKITVPVPLLSTRQLSVIPPQLSVIAVHPTLHNLNEYHLTPPSHLE